MLPAAQLKAITDNATAWMESSMREFEPAGKKMYTFDELYYNDIEFSGKQQADITAQYNALWAEKMLPSWSEVCRSRRSLILESTEYPSYLFKFCNGTPGRGNPAAHFLRVPKGKEMQRIVREEKLDQLLVVTEQLITMKTSTEIRNISESAQCYEFVVKSVKVPVMNRRETVECLASLPVERQVEMAVQVAKLICKSGIGDVGFHNILMHRDTKQLVFVDTEPLYGSLLLDEPYDRTQQITQMTDNLKAANFGLDTMRSRKGENTIFAQVAQIYKLCLN